eukprot:12752910-Alexandrium_andersonii.AAC.1
MPARWPSCDNSQRWPKQLSCGLHLSHGCPVLPPRSLQPDINPTSASSLLRKTYVHKPRRARKSKQSGRIHPAGAKQG